jgi:hypothetical protein
MHDHRAVAAARVRGSLACLREAMQSEERLGRAKSLAYLGAARKSVLLRHEIRAELVRCIDAALEGRRGAGGVAERNS